MVPKEVRDIQGRVMRPEVSFAVVCLSERRSAATEDNTGPTHEGSIVKPIGSSGTHHWDVGSWAVRFREVVATLKSYESAERYRIPLLRDRPRLGLLVAGPHFHTNPMRSRSWFTLASNSAT